MGEGSFIFALPILVAGTILFLGWMALLLVGSRYWPQERNSCQFSVSLIVPLFREDPEIFRTCLSSWARSGVTEIIGVIHTADESSADVFREFQQRDPRAKLMHIDVASKRVALEAGLRVATGELIALVDSDTEWPSDVLQDLIAPFKDASTGAVTPRLLTRKTDTFSRKLYMTVQENRCFFENRFLSVATKKFPVITGGTALYRRQILLECLDGFLEQKFFGKTVIGDDDAFLAKQMQNRSLVTYQSSAYVMTYTYPDLRHLWLQWVRWGRSIWRDNTGMIVNLHTWKHSLIFGLFLCLKVLQTTSGMLGPLYFLFLLAMRQWPAAVLILVWWIGRGLTLFLMHRCREKIDLEFLPAYLVSNLLMSAAKLYAGLTVTETGWMTR